MFFNKKNIKEDAGKNLDKQDAVLRAESEIHENGSVSPTEKVEKADIPQKTEEAELHPYPSSESIKRKRKKKKSPAQNVRRVGFVLIVAMIALTMFLFIASQFFDSPFLNTPKRVVSGIITNVVDGLSSIVRGTGNLLWKIKYWDTLEDEYNKLLAEVNTLKDQNQRMEALEIQLEQYKYLSDEIQRNKKFDGITADVIGVNAGNYNRTFVIDKGSRHGIKDNMAVAVPGALVGYTFDVDENRSSVRCIIDSESSVAALVENTRDQGTLSGTLALNGKNECRMYYLSYSTLPRPGDRVVTSGVGFEFPKGIPIGHVRETTRGLEDSKQYIVVEPIADFEHIESLIVYRYIPNYAEQAHERDSLSSSTYIPLPTRLPQATFFGQKSLLTPTPEPTDVTPAPTETVRPTFTPVPANLKPNYSYNDQQPEETENSTQNGATPSPSPTPKPTFSVDQMTVEDD